MKEKMNHHDTLPKMKNGAPQGATENYRGVVGHFKL